MVSREIRERVLVFSSSFSIPYETHPMTAGFSRLCCFYKHQINGIMIHENTNITRSTDNQTIH